jgi:DNA polymerase III subunit epsilon
MEAPAGSEALRAYRERPFPERDAPWREATFTVIDLETTGLDPSVDEIVSFGTFTVRRGRVQLEDARSQLVRPARMPEWDTIRIHGLREADLSDAPTIDQLLDAIAESLTGRVIVAHVAAVERGFLRAALASAGQDLINPIVDTAALDMELRRLRRQPAPDSEPIALSELARSLGLPVHRPHHADGDALTTAQAFIALATHLEVFESPLTVGTLQRISDRRGSHSAPGPVRRLLRRLGL